jgi:hypothetical protein
MRPDRMQRLAIMMALLALGLPRCMVVSSMEARNMWYLIWRCVLGSNLAKEQKRFPGKEPHGDR